VEKLRPNFALLGGLVLGIGFGSIQLATTYHGANRDGRGLRVFHDEAAFIAGELKNFKREHGRYPSNDDGLAPVAGVVKSKLEKSNGWLTRCRVTASGPLAHWGDPIIYENRRGLPNVAFRWRDESGSDDAYTYKVDDRVYLRSAGAMLASRRVAAKNMRVNTASVATLAATAALLISYYLHGVRKYANRPYHIRALHAIGLGVYTLFVALIVALPFALFMSGCGCPGMQIPRTSELTRAYMGVMRGYHKQGIIKAKTLERILDNLREDEKDATYRRS
jgi:hypothetical protein